jgi:type VI secretion system secreted protein Hcp
MAATHLLKVEGVKGESEYEGYSEHILLDSYNVGGTNDGTFSGTKGGSGGKYSANDFSATAKVSSATPKLAEFCGSGKHIKTATLVGLKSTGSAKPMEYHKITMSDVVISSHNVGYAPPTPGAKVDDHARETFTINYAKISHEYKSQTAYATPVPTEGAALYIPNFNTANFKFRV